MKILTTLSELVEAVDEGKFHYKVEQSITRTINTAERDTKKADYGNDDIYTTK